MCTESFGAVKQTQVSVQDDNSGIRGVSGVTGLPEFHTNIRSNCGWRLQLR